MSLRFDTAEQPSWLKSPPPRTNLDLAAQCSRSPAHCWPRPIICEKVERRRVAGLKLVVWGRRPRCYNSRLAQKRCFPWRRPRFLRDSPLNQAEVLVRKKRTPNKKEEREFDWPWLRSVTTVDQWKVLPARVFTIWLVGWLVGAKFVELRGRGLP